MDYRLWLLADASGRITLHGWSETSSDSADTAPKVHHWPTYHLCDDPAQLPARLEELGLELAAGADLGDLHRTWDVYLRHPDPSGLRASLDRRSAHTGGGD